MMENAISMPGSFLIDTDQPVRPTVTHARPSLYLPPSPSTVSSLSNAFLPSGIPHPRNSSRKRARYDPGFSNVRQAPQDDSDTDQMWAVSTNSFDSLQSPAPLVSTDYRLAGGLDTPTAATASIFADGQGSAAIDYRPSRFPSQTDTVADGYFPSTPDVLSRERNGRKRALPSPQYQGWGKAVCNIIGGMAGKVFNFCWTGAFRGFYAGGGRGYTMNICSPSLIEKSTRMNVEEKEDVFNQHYERQQYQEDTAIPGEFPAEGLTEDYMLRPQSSQSQDFSTRSVMGNRRVGRKIKSRETWVIVQSIDTHSRETSPTRKIPRTSTFNQSRPILRSSTTVRSRLTPSRPSRSSFAGSPTLAMDLPASFASPRRQIESSSAEPRPKTSEGHHRPSQQLPAYPKRSESVQNNDTASASPEVQKFERRLRQKEKAQQESIERLSQQTKDMIREARKALGTRIDIEDDAEVEDEGYGEGTELMNESKWW